MAKFLALLATIVIALGATQASSLRQQEIEYIAGHVMYRVVNKTIEYVLVQKIDELDDWSVPKGHIEVGEDATFGAQRETFEETGYVLADYTPFYTKSIYFEYTTNSNILKKVTVFPAKLTNVEKPVVIGPELNDFVWLNYNAALILIKKQYRAAFTEANTFIVAQELL